MDLRLNANAIITNNSGEILIVKLKGGPYEGRLCIPGGGINPGELSHDAIKREVFEETGIRINDDLESLGFCELINNPINKHRVVLILKASGEGAPKETEEAIAFWMNLNEAENQAIPMTKESIKMWKERKSHFSIIE